MTPSLRLWDLHDQKQERGINLEAAVFVHVAELDEEQDTEQSGR